MGAAAFEDSVLVLPSLRFPVAFTLCVCVCVCVCARARMCVCVGVFISPF